MNQRRSRRKVSGGLFPAGIKTAGGLPAALSGAVRFFVAALLVTTAGLIAGCSSAPPPVNRGLGEVPNAAAVHDDGNTGVYKGVLTSAEDSGRFILDIENRTDGTILMNGSLNDKDFSLAGTERPVAGGFAYDFSGATEDGGVQISFTTEISLTGELDRNGTSFDADGREIMVSMFKETSTELVRIFEGIYAGGSRGTWNFALKGGLITGRYAGDESGGSGETTVGSSPRGRSPRTPPGEPGRTRRTEATPRPPLRRCIPVRIRRTPGGGNVPYSPFRGWNIGGVTHPSSGTLTSADSPSVSSKLIRARS
jgi:hypothetical protein